MQTHNINLAKVAISVERGSRDLQKGYSLSQYPPFQDELDYQKAHTSVFWQITGHSPGKANSCTEGNYVRRFDESEGYDHELETYRYQQKMPENHRTTRKNISQKARRYHRMPVRVVNYAIEPIQASKKHEHEDNPKMTPTLLVKPAQTYASSVGYEGSAGALLVALDKIRERHLLDEYDFNFLIRFDDCVEKKAVADAIELVTKYNVDAFFGPTCNAPCISTGVISSVYNLPQYIWGFTTANELANAPRFPTVVIMTPNYFTLSLALLSVMDHFGWTEFAFIYSGDESSERCPIYLSDLQRAVFDNSKFTISFSTMWRNDTEAEMRLVLSELSQRARIVVLCSSTPSIKRKLLLLARDMGMITDEYAYIISDLGTSGYISFVKKYDSTFNSASEATVIWHGKPVPKSIPDCGFKDKCVIVVSIARAREIERLDSLWKIPFATLRKVTHKQSSFTSNLSEASSKNIELKTETEKMCFFYYGKEALMGFKHQAILKYEKFVNEEFRKMRQLEHDSVNRFFGVSMDSGLTYTLWRYCARGTLQS
ncbi:ligand-binding protein, receptor family [Ancylostoma ceylanicum]|uniref:Ligand-binding protein, receptor family n=1 Tax=Ancylostoma ceylanicum TaxID=53326 RepID=A0A0D6L4Q3_9BILA|nr:ligand-binding protein, receptor family [Ancylostoma ceylanicum]